MKPAYLKILSFFLVSLTFYFCQAQIGIESNTKDNNASSDIVSPFRSKHLNFFIVSKRKKGKLDLASRFNVFRTKIRSFFRHKKFVAIVAKDTKQMSEKVQYRLRKYNARLGTIWFDSHGMYIKGYSLFLVGHDEFNYCTVMDSSATIPLKQLARFADQQTKLVIGSCYGGATYSRPSVDYLDTTRMNGDSLMIGLGKIFNQSFIYASESWVMTKPGLFMKRAAVAGSPGRKLFRDVCYGPVWERLGIWNEYNAAANSFRHINPVTMDMYGNLIVRNTSYNDNAAIKKNIRTNMSRMKPWLYK